MPGKSKDILASPYWLPISILTYPLDFWQKIFAAGMAQSVEHIVHIDGANEGSVSTVGSAAGKRPEFVSAKRAASPLQGRAATIERTEHWFESRGLS